MEQQFQIFGSKSSQDYDVLLVVDELHSIDENHKLIKEWNYKLEKAFVEAGLPAKKVNCNLGIIKNNQVVNVFKGTYDEVNNSLYYTYKFHTQFFENLVSVPYDRTDNDFFVHLKLKRCFRFLLSFYSRVPELREDIKLALKGDFLKRLEVLSLIDFTKHTDFPKKKDKIEDIYKVIAFQLAQTLTLCDGIEIYTKEEAYLNYPELFNALRREPLTSDDLSYLNILLALLISYGEIQKNLMKDLNEEIFN